MEDFTTPRSDCGRVTAWGSGHSAKRCLRLGNRLWLAYSDCDDVLQQLRDLAGPAKSEGLGKWIWVGLQQDPARVFGFEDAQPTE